MKATFTKNWTFRGVSRGPWMRDFIAGVAYNDVTREQHAAAVIAGVIKEGKKNDHSDGGTGESSAPVEPDPA